MAPGLNCRLHIVVGGRTQGAKRKPLMLFVHGFPEIWYSWRHQMKVRVLQSAHNWFAVLSTTSFRCRDHSEMCGIAPLSDGLLLSFLCSPQRVDFAQMLVGLFIIHRYLSAANYFMILSLSEPYVFCAMAKRARRHS